MKLCHFFSTTDDRFKKYIVNGLVFKESATLLEAKILFDSNRDSEDVIVTANGKNTEDVIGWITNVIITDNSKA